MKFLCLHGNGTNANVMKLQTAPLRHELQDGHTYEFAEATLRVPFSIGMSSSLPATAVQLWDRPNATHSCGHKSLVYTITLKALLVRLSSYDSLANFTSGLEAFASPDDDFFSFYDEENFSSLPSVLEQLDGYIASQGPFDAVMGFSAGAVLAALHLLQKQRRGEDLPFRCAVFLSAGASAPALQSLGIGGAKDRVQIPSAHIWGSADDWAPAAGRDLSRLFEPSRRLNLIHDGGHEVPRKSFVTESVHVIRRIVALAEDC